MQIVRHNRYLIIAARLLAAAVVLRSLIAPGFMLSVSADEGLDIIFCNGPVAIHAPDSGHAEHHHDAGGTGNQSHVTPMCGHWSSSSHFIATALFVPSLDIAPLPEASAVSPAISIYKFPDHTRVTRGPPALA